MEGNQARDDIRITAAGKAKGARGRNQAKNNHDFAARGTAIPNRAAARLQSRRTPEEGITMNNLSLYYGRRAADVRANRSISQTRLRLTSLVASLPFGRQHGGDP
jgi:hypothetical protein